MEEPIKIYCHFLPNTQSQTQAVTECLHCSLQSTGSSPPSDDFETHLSRKTRPGVLQLMNRKHPGAQPQERFSRWAQADTWPGTHLRVLLVTAIEEMRTGDPQHNTLLPQGTQSFHGWKCFSDCAALRQSNNTDCKWQGTGWSQHTCKGSKGYHTAGSVTPWENRLELFL